jgi:hypothetical protein
VVKTSLFLSSFAPLFGLLALRFEPVHLWLPLALLAALGIFLLARLLRQRSQLSPDSRTFMNLRDEGAQVAGYLASYILPLLAISKPSWRDLLAYGLFIGLYAVVYINSDLMQVNPLLYVAGYRLYAAESIVSRETCYLLVPRNQARPTDGALRTSDVANNLLLVHPVEDS